jgi:drug/metabolite transporter (DMT)-like permease
LSAPVGAAPTGRSCAPAGAPAAVRLRERPAAPLAAAVIAVTVWGFGPVIIRGVSVSVPTLAVCRLWLSVPVLWLIMRATGGRVRREYVRLALGPAVLFAVAMVAGFAAVQNTSIANASLIPALLPVIVLLVAPRLFGDVVSAFQVGLAAVALAGTAAVVLGAGHTSGASFTGDAFAALNLLLFSVYFMRTQRVRADGVPAFTWVFLVMSLSAVVVTPWALVVSDDLGAMTGRDWLLVLLLILGPGAAGHGLMTWAQQGLDVTVGGLLQLLNPVVAAAGAWLIHGQRLAVAQMGGGLLVVASMAVLVVSQRRAMTATGEPGPPS